MNSTVNDVASSGIEPESAARATTTAATVMAMKFQKLTVEPL